MLYGNRCWVVYSYRRSMVNSIEMTILNYMNDQQVLSKKKMNDQQVKNRIKNEFIREKNVVSLVKQFERKFFRKNSSKKRKMKEVIVALTSECNISKSGS